MISFRTLYKIISQLQFSIRGYQDDHDIDEKLNELFQSMFEQQDLFANLKMRFLSFANARLSNVLEWKLTDYDKSFYFVPFVVSSNEDLLINEYYYLKNYVKQYSNSYSSDNAWSQIVLSGKAAQLSSILFKNSIIYRVKCDISIKTLSIGYESNILTILVPMNYFSFYNQENLSDEDADRLPLIKNRYEYIPNENISTYLPLCDDFTKYYYNELCNELVHCLKEINAQHSIFKLYEDNHLFDAIVGFANLLITHAYLSLIFKCWVESIPSVVNIDKEHTNSLGIVIWGYYDDCDILECRPLVQIIADRICASFAAHFTDLIGLVQKSQSESLKSAKAAIMSRNMSHNLGSHVMFYIKQKLQSVSKIVDNKVLENIIPGNIATIADIEENIKANKDIELPFLVGLGRFINYLQERQDYIATIATDYIPANSTISFKDFIYDELKPDLRYKRHHADNTDAGWQPGNLLLDYIAYSEQYRSSDDIVIKFNEFNGENAKDESDDFKELRKFNIAVPGGVIGRQALFSIFENIIRNAAKHSGRRNDNKLVLQLSLLDKDNNLFKSADFKSIRNDDNAKYDASGNILKAKYEGYFDKYHVLRIKIDMPNDAETITRLVDKLADPYIEENGTMKENSKGLKEMRISAAWLRGYSIDTEIPANEPPALSIYSEPYSGDKTKVSISYIICIPKPCRVAFIVQYDDCTAMNKMLAPYGCKVFTHEQLSDEKFIDEIANFEIVCMSKKDKNICSYLSSRNIINGNHSTKLLKNLIKSIEKTDYDAIEDSIGSVYETWFNNTYSHAISTMLCVADEQANQKNKKDKSLSNDDRVILTETGRVHEDDVKDAIVYSTHFKGLASKSDDDKYNKWLENAISIESVTGNNSTARLIRQDEWNKKWKTKLISAGLAKVAIFDERIFSSFISRKSITPRDGLNADVIIEEKKKFKNYGDFENELYKKYRVESSDALKLFTAKNRDQICKILKKYSITYTYDVAQKNHERRIWAFDVRLSEINPNEVEIVGYNTYIGERVGKYIEHKYDVALPIDEISYPEIPMARISYDRGICKVTLCDNEKVFKAGKSEVFDYITIHQGVLDKIYTAFGIKDNVIGKYRITNALHRCFSKHDTPKNKKAFLPNFIIHSGRSKPCVEDMPQPQPFVQFAAVDHAVKDCKYTLVELLATAHYEKGNNNN